MKRTLILTLILLLGLGTWWYTRSSEKSEQISLSAERDFGVTNLKDVARVELSYKDRDDVVLVKKGEKWYVNDSVEAWSPAVKGFLGTLRDISVKYTPPNTAKDHILKGMTAFGINVKILGKEGHVIKAYSIGGVTPGENGTYAQMMGSDQPFVVHIKFSEGGLRKQFDRTVEEWRNRFIFQEDWETISKVTVEYPRFPSRSFVMQKETGNAYALLHPGEPVGQAKKILKRGEAEAYLMHFEEVGIESFENEHKQRDSIVQLTPFVNITLQKEAGEVKWLKLYPLNHVSGEIDLSDGYVNSGQLFRFLGDYSSGDFIMIQHYTIGEALKKYDDFIR